MGWPRPRRLGRGRERARPVGGRPLRRVPGRWRRAHSQHATDRAGGGTGYRAGALKWGIGCLVRASGVTYLSPPQSVPAAAGSPVADSACLWRGWPRSSWGIGELASAQPASPSCPFPRGSSRPYLLAINCVDLGSPFAIADRISAPLIEEGQAPSHPLGLVSSWSTGAGRLSNADSPAHALAGQQPDWRRQFARAGPVDLRELSARCGQLLRAAVDFLDGAHLELAAVHGG